MTGPILPTSANSEQQYHLHEYVCDGGYSNLAYEIGTQRMLRVFSYRPEGCRYAILTCATAPNEVIVADLYEVVVAADGWVALGRHWVFPTVDAARAAAQMHYGTL